MTLTQQGLQASTALCQPLIRVTLWEEHRARYPIGCRFKAEADRHKQVFPAIDMTNFVLNAFLCGVHCILLPAVDPLQRLLNLCTQFMLRRRANLTECIKITVLWDATTYRLEDKYKHFKGTRCHRLHSKNEPSRENVYNTQNLELKPGISNSQEETVAMFFKKEFSLTSIILVPFSLSHFTVPISVLPSLHYIILAAEVSPPF